eukprot:TRINITY_DN25984_c0_g1_i1.p1 TRINITY_DN25984_c0_g1~~TRINITY_DN25984_c0_g1_i1.p1  ORF type:complete len:1024 (-),score=175.31 TRINITY_DN25984_c0_g1_i1:447-3518(-)
MEGRRLQVLERIGQLRAELHDSRFMSQTLRESAVPEEADTMRCHSEEIRVLAASEAAEAATQLVELVNTAYDQDDVVAKSAFSVEDLRELGEDECLLVCVARTDDSGGDSDGCTNVFRGCCAIQPAATNRTVDKVAGNGFTFNVPAGRVLLIAVAAEHRGRGLGKRLLVAAEERLAIRQENGVVFAKVPQSNNAMSSAAEWFGRRGYVARQQSRFSPPMRPSSRSSSEDTGYLSRSRIQSDCDSGSVLLTKTISVGFISRALLREVTAQQTLLSDTLAALEAEEAELVAAPASSSAAADADANPALPSSESPMLFLPYDVWVALAGGFGLVEVASMSASCRLFAQELRDRELWRHLFMRLCWPQTDALLHFSETITACTSTVDWRERLKRRAVAPPVIVVDVGRGYTKYSIVHGVRGRPEGEGQPPRLVQLCSSPTHPPDCGHGDQLRFISSEISSILIRAAADPSHPLHYAAFGSNACLGAQRSAVLTGLVSRPELNGSVVRLETRVDSGRYSCAFVQPPPKDRITMDFGLSGKRPHGSSTSNASPYLHNSGDDDDEDGDSFLTRAGGGVRPQPSILVDPKNLRLIRSAGDLPLLVGEPFAVTANGNSQGTRSNFSPGNWALAFQAQVPDRAAPIRIMPQAQMSLWAHGIDHGIVVNIGQGQTIAIPVITGQIAADAACLSDIGAGSLTQFMVRLLSRRFPWIDSRLMTWCRDLKEAYCYVAPPASKYGMANATLAERISRGDEIGIEPVQVGINRETIELTSERVLVPEALFDSSVDHGSTLPQIILKCAEKCLDKEECSNQEVLRALLRNIVLVGGTADIPGMRPRTEFEVRRLLAEGASPRLREAMASTDDVYVLNPPLSRSVPSSLSRTSSEAMFVSAATSFPLTSPRFVPCFGGAVRATSSCPIVSASQNSPLLNSCAAAMRRLSRKSSSSEGSRMSADGGRLAGALANLPGMASWVRRRLFGLNAPAIFRAGGGGGEEDRAWLRFGGDDDWQTDNESENNDVPELDLGSAEEVTST